jgi:ammonium transporter, Amt family
MDLTQTDILWVVLCAFLVFMMQLGFAMIETGTVRPKNTINVAMKNLIDTIFGVIVFWLLGFGVMFGADAGGLIGTDQFFIDASNTDENTYFFFQVMFAATSITIVSGAVAERMKFNGYVITSVIVIGLIYPLFGHWAWGEGGWLKSMGFIDFAGSTVVHSVGGWIGLAGAIMLGPRIGKFSKGRVHYFSPGNHNFIVFGVFILWFAWFGFNAGSLMRFDPFVTKILLNTLIAGAFGGAGGYLLSLMFTHRVGVEIFSFGVLAGLVGITAGCAELSAGESAFVGFVSAFVMYFFDQILINKWRIDDPLSVVSVHGFAGAWGTLAVGLFAALPEGMSRMHLIGVQATGIATAFVFAFGTGLLLFALLRMSRQLRVSHRNEYIGLNVAEHNAKLPWVETIESILRIMRSKHLHGRVHEERGTEVGTLSRFFNYLLDRLHANTFELQRSNLELQTQTMVDPLTGLLNRRGLKERVSASMPLDQGISLMVIDIDDFKKINDLFGHGTGDLVLQGMATILKNMSRKDDVVVRWGGEEFMIVIESLDMAVVESRAEKIRSEIEKAYFTNVGKVTCSFGVSTPRSEQERFDTLFEHADKALYLAKQMGKNRVCSW